MADAKDRCEWEERLQDWIDGDLDSDVSAEFLRHATGCAICSKQFGALQSLDAQLSSALTVEGLDEAFDDRLLERISLAAKADRAAARARVERDRQQQLAALAEGWRAVRRSVILNLLATISVLVAITASIEILPGGAPFIDRILPLMQQPRTSLTFALILAAACTALALLVVRLLSRSEG